MTSQLRFGALIAALIATPSQADELDDLFADPPPAAQTQAQPQTAAQASDEQPENQPETASPAVIRLPERPQEKVQRSPDPLRKIEEIIVTAQKTEQSLQDVPVSISAFSGDFMQDRGAVTIADMAAYVPNVQFSSDTDITLAQINIRGFGTSPLNSGFESSVGFVQDDLFLGRSPYITDGMFDVDRIEVLRGPQGTLFGKNTTAGVFSVYTKNPTPDFSGDIRLMRGGLNETLAEIGVGGMLNDWAGIRVAALDLNRGGGELYNSKLKRPQDRVEQQAQRIKLALTPLDALDMTLSVQNSDTSGSYWPVQLEGLDDGTKEFLLTYDPEFEDDGYNHQLSHNYDGYVEKSSQTYHLNSNWTIGSLWGADDVGLTLVLGDSQMSVDGSPDLDMSPADVATLRTFWDYDQRTLELRINGVNSNGLFGWGKSMEFIAGIFLMDSNMQQTTRAFAGDDLAAYVPTNSGIRQLTGLTLPLPLPTLGALNQLLAILTAPIIGEDYVELNYDVNTRTAALFGQMTWYLNEHWALTPGLRFNAEKKTADLIGQSYCSTAAIRCVMQTALSAENYQQLGETRDEKDLSPKLSLQYYPNDDVSLFATYAKGFKAGGYNAASFSGGDLQFEPENTQSWELGIKSYWLQRSLSINATAFYTDFDNLQTLAIDGAFINVGNAATATSYGLELDTLWLSPWPIFSLRGSFGYLHSRYDDYPSGQATVDQPAGSTQDLSGRELAFAPEFTASLSPTITLPLFGRALNLTFDWLYQGDQYTDIDLDPNTFVPAHSTYAARLAYAAPDGSWAVAIGGSNLTDENYATQVVDSAFFPGAYGVTQQAGRKWFGAITYRW